MKTKDKIDVSNREYVKRTFHSCPECFFLQLNVLVLDSEEFYIRTRDGRVKFDSIEILFFFF